MTRTAFLAAVEASPAGDDAAHRRAVAAEFTEQVDRENAGRTVRPVSYEEAVVVLGSRGPVVVTAATYAAHPAQVHREAGRVEAVIHGSALLGRQA